MKTIDEEIKFLVGAHLRAEVKGVGDAEFLERCKVLYLSGDVSAKAYAAAKVMYGEDAGMAELNATLEMVKRVTEPKKASTSSSGYGCGSSSSSSSGCGSSSRNSPSC